MPTSYPDLNAKDKMGHQGLSRARARGNALGLYGIARAHAEAASDGSGPRAGLASLCHTFVPVTDTTCWIYAYAWNPERPSTNAERALYKGGNGVIAEVEESYVPLRHKGNDYLIDRQLQKTKSYTGISGVSEQDAAVQDSQGPIADRTREHLGPTDLGILRFRKLVMDCATELARGKEPDAARRAERYHVRAGACITHKSKDLAAVMVERFGGPSGYVGGAPAALAD